MGRLLIVVCVFLLASPAAFAIQQQRDQPVAPVTGKIGSAVIAGRVTESADTNTPVRRAVVTLTSLEGIETHSVVADADGRFTFKGLPAGRYSLTARKGGHLTSSYGARRPGRIGTTLVVAEGQQLGDLDVVLPRGGVIAGIVRLADGEPLSNTQVIAIPVADLTLGGRVSGVARFETDDRGEYRIYGLTAGEYVVGAFPPVGRAAQRRAAAEYDAAASMLTAQQGRPGVPEAGAAPPAAPTFGYAPTYFPSSAVAARATRLRVGPGQVRDGVDVTVDLVPMSRVSGTVLGVDGQPTRGAQMQLEAIGPPLPISTWFGGSCGRIDESGRFECSSVAPGTYKLNARGGGVTFGPGGSTTIRSDDQTQWAVADVTVFGSDIEGIVLQLQEGLTFSGSLQAVGQAEAPATWKGARVLVQPVRNRTSMVVNGVSTGGLSSRSAVVNDDGTFEVSGIQPALYDVTVTLPAALSKVWKLSRVALGDRDLRDAPITFEQGSIANVSLIVSDQQSALEGTLSSAAGVPAPDYYIVAFPADRTLWHAQSPRVQVTRPQGDGRYRLEGLPAGAYRLAALTDVESDEWRSREFLESIYESSIAIAIEAAGTARQDIRIR